MVIGDKPRLGAYAIDGCLFQTRVQKAAGGGVAKVAPGRTSKENKPFRAQFDAASEAWRKQESHQWASETSGRFRSIIIGRLRRPSFNLLFSPGLAAGKCALRAFCFGRSTRSYAYNTAFGGFFARGFETSSVGGICTITFQRIFLSAPQFRLPPPFF